MKFWDASAIVPLIVEERPSKACRQLLRTDPEQLVWWLARVEVIAALWRQASEGRLNPSEIRRAEARLEMAALRWHEVEPHTEVRETAERLLRAHPPLRAAGALQLAAALSAFSGRPRKRGFVTLDDALGVAALREGFDVLAPR